jgi:hypothetical protein
MELSLFTTIVLPIAIILMMLDMGLGLILVPTYFVSASLGNGLLPFNDEAISKLRTQLS